MSMATHLWTQMTEWTGFLHWWLFRTKHFSASSKFSRPKILFFIHFKVLKTHILIFHLLQSSQDPNTLYFTYFKVLKTQTPYFSPTSRPKHLSPKRWWSDIFYARIDLRQWIPLLLLLLVRSPKKASPCKKFLVVGKACVAIFWPTPGLFVVRIIKGSHVYLFYNNFYLINLISSFGRSMCGYILTHSRLISCQNYQRQSCTSVL